jgi:cell division protein FtsL
MMRIGAVFIVLLLVATIASALGVVYARQRHRQLFIQLTSLERERDDVNIEFGRLQLEQATWAETNRIEQIATGKLGMVYPNGKDVVVVRP